jgi:hypothetical protein
LFSLRDVEIAVSPLHVVDLRFGPDIFLRFAMARYAPFHLQSVFLENGGHVIDLAVTGRAAYTLGDVNAVVEVGVLGQIVYALPFDWRIAAKAFSYRL